MTASACAELRDLGTLDYARCWQMQQRLFETLVAEKRGRGPGKETQRGPEKADEGPEKADEGSEKGTKRGPEKAGEGLHPSEYRPAGTILLVEHPPVYTLGKSGHAENLLVDRAALERLGAGFFHIDRGGDITFHGPGQLVCYPILDLECLGIGLREYIDRLEEAVIRTVARYGIAAGRIAGASGVWIAERPEQQGVPRKICAIGVRSSRYVTMHGFALNVTTDLAWFSRINPCGFRDRGVTSILRETGREVPMDEVKKHLVGELQRQLGVETSVQ